MIRRFKQIVFNWFFARVNNMFWRLFINTFGITLSLIYGVIAGVSILGFLGIYQPSIGVILGLAVSVIIYYWFTTRAQARLLKLFHRDTSIEFVSWLESIFIVSGLLLLCLLILVPVARWPNSYSGDWFVWDAGVYHFPKAIELYKSGTIWDLSIPYGEYPFGYESLLTFALSLSNNESLFGFIHVVIILLFFTSILIIAKRLTNISPGLLLLFISLMILSDNLFQTFNLWRIFTQDIYTVGKNDLLLSATQLSFIVFALMPFDKEKNPWLLVGCSLAGMMALAIKPNSVFLVAPLLIIKIWGYLREKLHAPKQQQIWKDKELWKTAFLMLLLILPGLLWAIRNQISMGRFFSNVVMELSNWSILANITNPYFFNYIPKNLIVIVTCLMAGIVISIFWRKDLRFATFIYFLLLFGFISTPVSGFFQRVDVPTQVSWRFAETLLAFVFIYLLAIITPHLQSLINKALRLSWVNAAISIAAILVCGWLFLSQFDKMQWKPENEIILHDQFTEPVGTKGYRSAYDFIQRNVRDSVIWVENGLPYYVYGPGFTNTISRNTRPDYLLIIHTDWFGGGRVLVPSHLDKEGLQRNYELVYQDEQGSVYKHR